MHSTIPARDPMTHPVAGAAIRLENVSIAFGANRIVSDVSLDIAPGEFVCLLGPSGCGKSTLLNLVAGFMRAAGGRALVDGVPVSGPDQDRGVVFQSTEVLFPWLTVRENIEYGPKMRGIPKDIYAPKVAHYLKLAGLNHAADRRPGQISGGMRQRTQIARVLVNEPRVVLMDEPFGALDAQTREVMQSEVDRIWRATRPTILFITHDIWEAILLGDRIITMTAGPGARFKSVRNVTLPRPRDTTTPEAVALYRDLRADIAAEVERALAAQGIESGPAQTAGEQA